MMPMLDCLVSYFGLDERQEPNLRRYYCYHIVGGPGPTAESGVASVTTLAVYDESKRCTYCQTLHAVETGGPEAAIARAIRYLDAYHAEDRLRKVQSEMRGLGGHPTAATAPLQYPAPARAPLFDGDPTPTR